MRTAALIVAGGRGVRAGAASPKQYALVGGTPVLTRTLRTFVDSPIVDRVAVVIGPQDFALYSQAIGHLASAPGFGKLTLPVIGGDTRQGSVLNGLRALVPHAPDQVLIHDAVRPFVTAELVERVLDASTKTPGAIAAVPLADSLKRTDSGQRIAGSIERAGLWRAQTPQAFRFADIIAAHEAAAKADKTDFTDDAAVAEWAGLAVTLVEASESNRKITTAEDLAMAQTMPPPACQTATPDIRTGQGFDVHRFVPGDHVWLCGVRVPHDRTLEGHSDADVGLHALTDALLGAIGDGDIGEHFSNTDPRWKSAASHLFLSDAAQRVRARGGIIANADVTLLCEAPKVAPHRNAMRGRIAAILGIDVDRVAVKATTTEGLGFTGRREGIAALATATVILR